MLQVNSEKLVPAEQRIIHSETLEAERSAQASASPTASPKHERYGEPVEQTVDMQVLIQSLHTDINAFAGFLLPETFVHDFSPIHETAWYELIRLIQCLNSGVDDREADKIARKVYKIAFGIPRGFAKTTLIKLLCAYCILFTKFTFIAVVAANQGKADAILSDVMDLLEGENVVRLVGDWRVGKERSSASLKLFKWISKSMILVSSGVEGGLRGTNYKNRRPQIIIADDIQSAKSAKSPTESKNLIEELVGTIGKLGDPTGSIICYIGNMFPETKKDIENNTGCILAKLKRNPDWLTFISAAILSNGTSLWEAVYPIRDLLREYASDKLMGFGHVFLSEKQNISDVLKMQGLESSVLTYPWTGEEKNQRPVPMGKAIIIDPATHKENADEHAIAYCELLLDVPTMIEVMSAQMSPKGAIEEALNMCMRTGCTLICIESNAYQETLIFWFNEKLEELGITEIQVLPLYSGVNAKLTRILSAFSEAREGRTAYAPSVKDKLEEEISQFDVTSTTNKDNKLDTMYYMGIVFDKYPLESRNYILEAGRSSGTIVGSELIDHSGF